MPRQPRQRDYTIQSENVLESSSEMDIKERPNHKLYTQTLRRMSAEQRLLKSFELSEFSKGLFLHGLHRRFPQLSEASIKRIYLERLDKCHNRNY